MTPKPDLIHFRGGLAVAENALEIFGGFATGFGTLKHADHFFG